MTREIKFRSWDKILKIMSYNSVDAINFKGQILLNDGKFHDINKTDYILMQYTGVVDKNGKDIYEGDIVRIWANPRDYGGYKGHNYTGVVEYEEFSLGFILSDGHGLRDFEFIEIIGNIYENPELLGGKND